MGQKDLQATPVERLRWADALGLLPAESRTSKLDRAVARLSALHSELLFLQPHKGSSNGVDDKDSARLAAEFVQALKNWNAHLTDVESRLEKNPRVQTGDAASILSDLRKASDQFNSALGQAAQRSRPDEAAGDIPWLETGSRD